MKSIGHYIPYLIGFSLFAVPAALRGVEKAEVTHPRKSVEWSHSYGNDLVEGTCTQTGKDNFFCYWTVVSETGITDSDSFSTDGPGLYQLTKDIESDYPTAEFCLVELRQGRQPVRECY